MKFLIGMRYLKTALAVTLCILIARALNSEYPFFAAVAAVISMENTVANSFESGKSRVLGTLIGGVVGAVFVLLGPENAFLCGLGTIIIIYLCSVMQWANSIAIGTIVFLSIMLNLGGQSPWLYSLSRVEDTMLGILVALAVNYLIFPYKPLRQLAEGEAQLLVQVNALVRGTFCLNETPELGPILQEIIRLEEQYALHAGEFRIGKKEDPEAVKLLEKLETYRDLYAHFKMLVRLNAMPELSTANIGRLNALGFEQLQNGKDETDDLSVVFNYHVGKILDKLELVSA